MVTFRKVGIEESVLLRLQDISRVASAKEHRKITLSEIVGIGLDQVIHVFGLEENYPDSVNGAEHLIQARLDD
jgi:hypothetical protein